MVRCDATRISARAFERIGDFASRPRRSLRWLSPLYDGRMATPDSGALVGREGECAVIDGLLEASARGESSCIVLRGEAGSGKTALLEYAESRGSGSKRWSR